MLRQCGHISYFPGVDILGGTLAQAKREEWGRREMALEISCSMTPFMFT